MKKIFFRISQAIFIVCLISLAVSCKKETPLGSEKNTVSNENVSASVVNGRLVFCDQSAFEQYIEQIYNFQDAPEKIGALMQAFRFTSMNDVYTIGMNKDKSTEEFSAYCKAHPAVFSVFQDEESLIYELQAPLILSYIANENGIFQVGQKIIRVTSDYTLTIVDGDESKIPILMQPIGTITNEAIEIVPTRQTKGEYSYRTAYFDNTHRIVARLTSSLVGSMYYYEARTTAQKRTLGIWVQENIYSIQVNWAAGSAFDGTYTYTIAASNNSAAGSDINRVVVFTMSPVIFSSSSCIATHIGTRSGVTVYVSNNDIFPN